MVAKLSPEAIRERNAALNYCLRNFGPAAASRLNQSFKDTFRRIAGALPPGSTRTQYSDRKYLWVHLQTHPYFVVWTDLGRGARLIVTILNDSQELKSAWDRTGFE